MRALNYELDYDIVNFSEYGIPQSRNRFILVGKLGDVPISFFNELKLLKEKLLTEKGINKTVSLKEAIGDLLEKNGKSTCPDSKNFFSGLYAIPTSKYQSLMRKEISISKRIPDSHRFVNHSEEIIQQFQALLKHGERNKRINKELKEKYNIKKRSISPLAKDLPCPVLMSIPDEYIHYQEPRVLTVREYARIQSFPDWYEIKGKYTTGGQLRKRDVPRYTQLANAIPPLFAEQVGITLKQFSN